MRAWLARSVDVRAPRLRARLRLLLALSLVLALALLGGQFATLVRRDMRARRLAVRRRPDVLDGHRIGILLNKGIQ